MSEWQPIETAPKDGTRVFLWRGYPKFGSCWAEMVAAEWHDGEWCWPDPRQNPSVYGDWSYDDLAEGYAATEKFTHWAHLLPPPKQKAPTD